MQPEHSTQPQQEMLRFTGIASQRRGTIAELLENSYVSFYSQHPEIWSVERKEFADFDQLAFDNQETVGRCVLFSHLGQELVGMASFDPRKGPDRGIIGHNCILPEFRGRGLGKLQIEAVLREFSVRGFQRAVVSTGDHPFFVPAQRMYLACGFVETRRGVDPPRAPDSWIKMIEYERLVEEPREIPPTTPSEPSAKEDAE